MDNDRSAALFAADNETTEHRIEQMLEVQGYALVKEKAWDMLDALKVLTLQSHTSPDLNRGDAESQSSCNRVLTVNHISDDQYLALSYTWAPSLYEEKSESSWQVIDPDRGPYTSAVRNIVFDRVAAYMLQTGIKHLWVDRECIDQTDKEEKQRAMQSMDLVYRTSAHALGLLFVPLRTVGELKILEALMEGQLFVQDKKRKRDHNDAELALCAELSLHDALHVLDLLLSLTSDEWWSRGWCFQESYLSMGNMQLLLPNGIQNRKDSSRAALAQVRATGDYSVDLSTFCIQTTKFVFGYIATGQRQEWLLDRGICRQILDKAGWYNLMAEHGHLLLDSGAQGRPMSTQILADLQRKNYSVPSDLLHVAANCNRYQFAFNTKRLDDAKTSLSSAILTMFFLNGEIFWNCEPASSATESKMPADANVFDYLKAISFHAFPVDGREGRLSHLRMYRFVWPRLKIDGVEAWGHLWKLHQVLDLQSGASRPKHVKGVLQTVVDAVSGVGERQASFFQRLKDFIKHEYAIESSHEMPESTKMMSIAAARLAKHIQDGGRVGLAAIRQTEASSQDNTVGAGIFALSDAETDTSDFPSDTHFFTAWQRGGKDAKWFKRPEEDKYVSLRVLVDEVPGQEDIPQLRVCAWTDAICFFERVRPLPYLFPWPRSLLPALRQDR